MADIDEGLQAWQQRSNNNRIIDLQADDSVPTGNQVTLSYFGSSAFQVTSPGGVRVTIDPWRNLPTRRWDWYFHDFPRIETDIGVSTHAHFDHDALHRLDAHVLLDRLVGTYTFRDVTITGIADKHAIDSSNATYDFKKIIEAFSDITIEPPNNPRSWDNCLVIVETGGLRILHWGDNRHNPPDDIWERIGRVDIALLPVDDSEHVMGYGFTHSIIDRLKPAVVVPHHYYIWDVVQRSSTLLPVTKWLEQQAHVRTVGSAVTLYSAGKLPADTPTIDYFGDHVAFDKTTWHESKGEAG